MIKFKKSIILPILFFILTITIITQTRKSQEEVVLEFGMFVGSNWGVANANSYILIDKAIEEFEKNNPNVKINYYSGITREDYSEWLSRQIIMGKTPDVFMVLTEDFNKLSSLDVLKNLDNLIETDKDFDPNKYYSTSLSTGSINSSQYALPFETVPKLMCVNTTLLNKNNIDIPSNNWTWEELYEVSNLITKDTNNDGRIDQFGILNYNWVDAVYSNDGELFDFNGKEAYFTDDNVIDSIKFVEKLGKLNEGTTVSVDDFNSGNVAFMPMLFSEYRTYKTYPYKIKKYTNFKWDFIMLPSKSGKNLSEVQSLLLGVSKKTKNEKLAWEFIKQLTYDEKTQLDIFKYSQGSSVLKNVTESTIAKELLAEKTGADEKVIDNILLSQIIENGVVAPQFSNYQKVMDLANSKVNDIIEKSNDMDSSMKILQRQLIKYLDE